MIGANSLEFNRDPQIPESLKNRFPKYLVARLIAETGTEREDEGRELADENEIDEGECEAQALQTTARRGVNRPQPAPAAKPATDQKKGADDMPEPAQLAAKGARTTRQARDKFTSDINAALATSKGNPNSNGCKIEQDLATLAADLQEGGKNILQFEQQCVSSLGKGATSEHVEEAGAQRKELDDDVKKGCQKLAALKSLWKPPS